MILIFCLTWAPWTFGFKSWFDKLILKIRYRKERGEERKEERKIEV